MDERKNYLHWDEYFMSMAFLTSARSKDPNSQVGAVIVDQDNHVLSLGYNGAPNGFSDSEFPWMREGNALDTKYMYVVHSEMNAILNYPGEKNKLKNARIYVTLFPCNECTKAIIQSGIKEVIYANDKYANTDGVVASKIMLKKCDVKFRECLIDSKTKTLINELFNKNEKILKLEKNG